jgi:hypothetical protein
MSKFSHDQANNSKIMTAEKILKDGQFSHWIFGIEDEDGIYYDWEENTLGSTVSISEQRTSIYNYLTNSCEKEFPTPLIQIQNSEIIGEIVGATGGN